MLVYFMCKIGLRGQHYGASCWRATRHCFMWMLSYREKLSAAEQKLRGAVQDKQHAVTEKAALEREVKTLKGQAGKLTKVFLFISRPSTCISLPDLNVQADD